MSPLDWLAAVRQNGSKSLIPPEPPEAESAQTIEKPCEPPETPCDLLYILDGEEILGQEEEKFSPYKETERFSGGDRGNRGNHRGNEAEGVRGSQGESDWPEAMVECPTGAPVYLSADQTPWLGVAERVLAHEFEHADDSTVESLTIGLRGIRHPICQKALARLRPNKEKPREN